NKFELNKGSVKILDQILPILSMAKKRFKTEAQNRIEAVILQECTTIHSSVKWRFEEEACKFIEMEQQGEQPEFKDIVFDHLYPLYGQLDIKGSSERRNKAVGKDLIKQMKSVGEILRLADKRRSLPLFEELMFRLNAFVDELKEDVVAGSEPR